MSTAAACPLCGDVQRMRHSRVLYGNKVCKKCAHGFANRRQFAFVIDLLLLYVAQFLGVIAAILLTSGSTGEPAEGIDTLITFGFLGLFIAKDGFGSSPGKKLTGVRAVHRDTGAPIGFGASAARNLPVLLPLVPLLLAFQLVGGYRFGDGWAKSKVIWCKYSNHPIFTDQPLGEVDDFGPQKVDLPPVEDTANPFQAPRT